MKIFIYSLIIFMGFLPLMNKTLALEPTASTNKTIYLVRHAEKQLDKRDPALTACGTQRAKQLATMLEEAGIEKVYSTNYQRTKQTAAPLAQKLNLEVNEYDPRKLAEFSKQVKKEQGSLLIVGHSNTTPQLTALVANTVVKPITEKEYQMLYQITFINERPQLTLLKQPLTCSL